MAFPKTPAPKTVKILAHPATSADAKKSSGVLTSQGDKFHGETVTLPGDEADLLIAIGRAEEVQKKSVA